MKQTYEQQQSKNHIHRIIFNRAYGVCQAVSEIAKSGQGSGAASSAACVLMTAVAMLSTTPTLAGGDGGYGGNYGDANYKGPGWTQGSSVTGSGGVGGQGSSSGSGGGSDGAAGQIATSPVNNAADVRGSAGGGSGHPRNGGGGGGDGLVTSANAINSNSFTGGNGGDVSVGVGGAGGGGGGGAGLVTSANVTNTGSIKGGDGGTSSPDNAAAGGGAGGGGAGGAGLFGTGLVVGPLVIVNSGNIVGGRGGAGTGSGGGSATGGRGGAGSGGALGGTRSGVFAAGGAGIMGVNLAITNSGIISGGLSGDGSTRAAAVLFTGGTSNSLNLQTGSLLDGAVEIGSGATASIVAQANGLTLTNNLILGGAGTLDTQANNMTVSGAISGTSSMYKTGSGTLNLTGNSTLNGTTSVNSGTLLVNGSLANSAVTVNSGSILGGSGTVGNTTIVSGGMLAPGNSIGTLTVAGDLHFLPGAIYRVEADPDSSASDRVAVTGTAHLAGSVMHVGPEGGFASMRQYTILSASAVQGQFDSVRSNYAYLDPTLRYGAQDVTLQLERKLVPVDPAVPMDTAVPVDPVTPPTRPIAFADAAQTGNQRATANGLDSLSADNPLHEFILTLPTGAPPAVFDNLSGEIHASVASSLIGAGATARTLPLAHLRANLGAGMQPGALLAQAGGALPASALPISNAQPAWAEVVGNWQTLQGDSNAAKATHRTGGLFIGADHAVGGGWRVGAALGYTEGKTRVDERASKADVSSYSAALYGGRAFDVGAGKLNFLAGSAYTWHNLNTRRYATVSQSSQKLTADYGANTTQLFTELGYAMPLSKRVTVEPFAGLAWSHLRTRGFSESGGSAALSGQPGSDAQTSTTLGLRAQTGFSLGQAEGHLRATLGWRHAFGDVTPQSTMAFQGGQAFTVAGAPIARDAALTELGVDMAIARHATLGVSYSGQYGGGNREHTGSLNVRWRY